MSELSTCVWHTRACGAQGAAVIGLLSQSPGRETQVVIESEIEIVKGLEVLPPPQVIPCFDSAGLSHVANDTPPAKGVTGGIRFSVPPTTASSLAAVILVSGLPPPWLV